MIRGTIARRSPLTAPWRAPQAPETLSTADEIAAWVALRSGRRTKVEWLGDDGRACSRASATRARITKRVGPGASPERILVTEAEADALLRGPLL